MAASSQNLSDSVNISLEALWKTLLFLNLNSPFLFVAAFSYFQALNPSHPIHPLKMPSQTEALSKKPAEEKPAADSGTESDNDSDNDSVPDLEETGAGGGGAGQTQGPSPLAAAAGLNEELVSKAKQSRGEKKARKIMSKLGLKQVAGVQR